MEALQIHYVDLGVQRVADLKGDMSIGRTEGNDLVLNHPSVSRKHARFEGRSDAWWVVDLKSTNGVKVNGNLVTESKVNSGDKISIGSVQLELTPQPSVNFSNESMFDNPSGTVIRRISDMVEPPPSKTFVVLDEREDRPRADRDERGAGDPREERRAAVLRREVGEQRREDPRRDQGRLPRSRQADPARHRRHPEGCAGGNDRC